MIFAACYFLAFLGRYTESLVDNLMLNELNIYDSTTNQTTNRDIVTLKPTQVPCVDFGVNYSVVNSKLRQHT